VAKVKAKAKAVPQFKPKGAAVAAVVLDRSYSQDLLRLRLRLLRPLRVRASQVAAAAAAAAVRLPQVARLQRPLLASTHSSTTT